MKLYHSQVGVGILKGSPDFDNQVVLDWKSTIWKDLFTPAFLTSHPKLKGIVITETERLTDNVDVIVDFQILNPPTGEEFIKVISQPDIKSFLPFVGNIKAGKDGKIAVVKKID